MDGIILLRTFGHRSSSFFNHRLSIGSLKILLWVLGGVVLLSILLLTVYATRMIQPLDDAFVRLERIDAVVQDISTEHRRIEHYLATGIEYESAEQSALNIQEDITRLALLSDDYSALSRLDIIGADYLNLLRSYHSIISATEAGDTLTLLRDQLDATGTALDQQANMMRKNNLTSVHDSVPLLANELILLAAFIVLLLSAIFAASMSIVNTITQHSARILRDLREVTYQITEGHFDARINLTGEVDSDVIQLGRAFNHMADNLHLALQAESAATEQNHQQLLKLARQERMTAILEERQRIARELHDSVKQQLFSITLSAGAVINMLHDAPPLAKTHLEHIKQAGHSAQSEMTILLQELVSAPLQDKRLEDALLDYLNPLCHTHQLKLLWRAEGTNTLTIAHEHALFRAVQEAVSNVIRHSGATVLRVSLRYGLLTHVIVEDNGSGFAPEAIAPTSNGLAMMRTRLKHVGGHCELQSEPGTGTRLMIQLDLRKR